MSHLARQLAEQGALRTDTILNQTTGRRWMLCSFEAFDLPHTGRGLSVEYAARALAIAPSEANH